MLWTSNSSYKTISWWVKCKWIRNVIAKIPLPCTGEKVFWFCKAHLGFHSHQTVGWGSFPRLAVRCGFHLLWLNSHLMNCEMGRSFLGLVSQPCPMGKEQGLEGKKPSQVSTVPVHPHIILYCTLCITKFFTSVTKWEGLEIQEMDHYHLLFVKLLLQRWHEGLKSPELLVLRTSRSPEASSVTGFPEEEPWTPLQWVKWRGSDGSSCKPSPTMNPGRLQAPRHPIGLEDNEAPCGRLHRWINRIHRGEISTAERNPSWQPQLLTQDSHCPYAGPLCPGILADPDHLVWRLSGLECFFCGVRA